MTSVRQLARLEATLSPTAATLLWLAEAQAYRSLAAYVAWLSEQPLSAAPLERVPGQAQAAVVAMTRGQLRDDVRAAASRAVRDAVFLVELVFEVNAAAAALVGTAGLRVGSLAWQRRALEAKASGTPKAAAAAGWRTWREDVAALLITIDAADLARKRLERQYLDGHGALFSELIEEMTRAREEIAHLVEASDTHVLVRRRTRNRDALRAAADSHAPAIAARIIDDARLATLDILGEGAAAGAIAARRFRVAFSRDDPIGRAAVAGTAVGSGSISIEPHGGWSGGTRSARRAVDRSMPVR